MTVRRLRRDMGGLEMAEWAGYYAAEAEIQKMNQNRAGARGRGRRGRRR
jgi:hypothetical protein